VEEVKASLVVIDPLTAFLGGNANSDQSVRKCLGPVARFAEQAGTAVLIVRHCRKQGTSCALYRGAGSIAIVAVARSAMTVVADPGTDDPFRHVLVQMKTNLSQAGSLAYRTVKRGDAICIDWLGPSPCMVHDLLDEARSRDSALRDAAYIVYSLLAEGPVPASEVIGKATSEGVSKRTLDRAKAALRVKVKKRGSGRGSSWIWQLPNDKTFTLAFRDRELDDLMEQLLTGGEEASDFRKPKREPRPGQEEPHDLGDDDFGESDP
jgi:hypothetical protein